MHSAHRREPFMPYRGGGDAGLAPKIALSILMVALGSVLAAATLHLLTVEQNPVQLLIGATALLGMFASQVALSAPRRVRLSRRQQYALLGVQVLLSFPPLLLLGTAWVGLIGFLTGSLLLTLRSPWSWLTAGATTVGTMALTTTWSGKPVLDVAYIGVSTVMVASLVYGLTALSEMVLQLRSAQQEIARLAVEQERLRFARDLHDLLGYSLSAITLRSELTLRLVEQQPARAREELSTVLQISRQALADTRQVARSYRDMSFADELASARSVFGAAGIAVEVDCTLGAVPDQIGTVLATVLREGVTNILRHSAVRHCRISVRNAGDGQAVLHVRNDGVAKSADRPTAYGGSGIGNLSARVATIGGALTAEVREDGCFHLVARVPLDVGEALRGRRPRLVEPLPAEAAEEASGGQAGEGKRSAV
ncbi:histidine kinase [Streptomyces sp. HNM0663]|uniref:Histidine kinase n=1 Tax=Streptomyces chengmaiensis TaxID=3040919 RepID=A0ABT6HQ14_9ACTN|nr:histidine kinase [Streptomyces chengmaiensis]MDH2390786.1 histidine kinase [Streptomyces chengmaiensis]